MPIPDDVAAFLGRQTRVFLVTRRRDGAPTIHPMTGTFAAGRVTMSTYRKSAKARNVERDPRAACLVVNGYGTDELRRAELPAGAGRAAPQAGAGVAATVADRMASGKRVFLDVEADDATFVQRLWSD
jgi:hypothetical protein